MSAFFLPVQSRSKEPLRNVKLLYKSRFMPTYDYTCSHCRQQMEAFQKITDEPLVECPECKRNALQRGIGGGQASFQFKGKGFYITDYKQTPAPKSGECCPCGKNKDPCSS